MTASKMGLGPEAVQAGAAKQSLTTLIRTKITAHEGSGHVTMSYLAKSKSKINRPFHAYLIILDCSKADVGSSGYSSMPTSTHGL
jgi:hypothetical protein